MERYQLQNLFDSIDELERTIRYARQSLKQQDAKRQGTMRRDILARILNYETNLQKQRTIAADLVDHLRDRNWPEVARDVKLISALSSMIRDDAIEILTERETSVGDEARFEMN